MVSLLNKRTEEKKCLTGSSGCNEPFEKIRTGGGGGGGLVVKHNDHWGLDCVHNLDFSLQSHNVNLLHGDDLWGFFLPPFVLTLSVCLSFSLPLRRLWNVSQKLCDNQLSSQHV